MKYIHTKDLRLSRFMLGTVQLGMDYGLGPDRAKPSSEKAFAVLDQAAAQGVNAIDTANNYGDAEHIIGQWLQKRRGNTDDLPWVVTKIGPLKSTSFDALRDEIYSQVDACRQNLGVEKIDCLMLHNCEDYIAHSDEIQRIFAELRDDQAFRFSAISAYTRHDYGMIAESGFDAVQIPLNVFDWRQIESGGIEKLAKAGMMIFARSVFLQGLVVHAPEELDRRMEYCVPVLETYRRLCREFELSPAVLALSFVLSVPGITSAVLGCDNPTQVKENAGLFDQTVKLTQLQWQSIKKAFLNTDDRITDPGKWYNHT